MAAGKLDGLSAETKKRLKEKLLAKRKVAGGSGGGKKTPSRPVTSKAKPTTTIGKNSKKLYSTISGPASQQSGSGRQRYAAKVERGESAYSKEWSGFVSGVKMSEMGAAVNLKKSDDLSQQDAVAGGGYSYLFQSASEKKATRQAKVETARAKVLAAKGPKESKMQRTLQKAKVTGMAMPSEGMNRKERRRLLRLTVTEEEEKARNNKTKPQDLMDTKLAWYQQGPAPLDQIAERLVTKKAEKKAKQLGLKYNYLKPHPSWMAARSRTRLLELPALGVRTILDTEDDS